VVAEAHEHGAGRGAVGCGQPTTAGASHEPYSCADLPRRRSHHRADDRTRRLRSAHSGLTTLEPTKALDDLETVTHETGNAILRQARRPSGTSLMRRSWHSTASSVVPSRSWPMGTRVSPSRAASVLDTVAQVCQQGDPPTHVLPSNAVLPPHHGMSITRGLQEWVVLEPAPAMPLPELVFALVAVIKPNAGAAEVLTACGCRTVRARECWRNSCCGVVLERSCCRRRTRAIGGNGAPVASRLLVGRPYRSATLKARRESSSPA
jgi:hypothetical protein